MVLIVSRSKLILDFAITLHLIHLVVVTFSSGLVPRAAFWWGTMVTSCAVMTVGGTYGCRWRELQPINFGGRPAGAAGGANATSGNSLSGGGQGAGGDGEDHGDEEMGFSRGRSRGRGRDGGGEYEMVGVTAGDNR